MSNINAPKMHQNSEGQSGQLHCRIKRFREKKCFTCGWTFLFFSNVLVHIEVGLVIGLLTFVHKLQCVATAAENPQK